MIQFIAMGINRFYSERGTVGFFLKIIKGFVDVLTSSLLNVFSKSVFIPDVIKFSSKNLSAIIFFQGDRKGPKQHHAGFD